MAKMKFGGVTEMVVTRKEFPLSQARRVLKHVVIAVLGYGVQGPAQALNLKDNGFKVIVGQRRPSACYTQAKKDGWKPGENLFSLEVAAEKGTLLGYLLSDAGQMAVWPQVRPHLTQGKTLYFSHGFGVTYAKYTGIVPPKNVDVIMVAPKGSGRSVRQLFLQGKGINSSYAVEQDYSGKARDKALAMGMGIGSGYLFETTFAKEVYSDLTGERGVLMGAMAGIMEAQYNLLRQKGHSPAEAFNETVEEATQSLIPLVGENGMEWMFANCSTTAQRGALDWRHKFRRAVAPVFTQLYRRVKSGHEAKVVIEANSRADYKRRLEQELKQMGESEMWRVGQKIRRLRP